MFYDLLYVDGHQSSLGCSDGVFFLGSKDKDTKKPPLPLLDKRKLTILKFTKLFPSSQEKN